MLVASDEATSGSVIANADRISPASSGRSHCFCCASLPNCASTSILPVSGAAQFSAVGANCGLRPVISASGAYWRLVSPAPCSSSGKLCWSTKNRFHSPCRRASAFSSSTTAGVSHGEARAERCSWAVCSAGYTCSSMNVSSRSRSSSVRASNAKSMVSQPSLRVVSPWSMKTGTSSPIRSKPAPTVWPSV